MGWDGMGWGGVGRGGGGGGGGAASIGLVLLSYYDFYVLIKILVAFYTTFINLFLFCFPGLFSLVLLPVLKYTVTNVPIFLN